MTLRKAIAAATTLVAAATVSTASPAAVPRDLTCPVWYGFHNAATGSCLPWSRHP